MNKFYSLLLLAGLCLLGVQSATASYYVCGTMNNWTLGEDIMTQDGTTGVYYKQYEGISGSHQFKINDGTWNNEWTIIKSTGDVPLSGGSTSNIQINFPTGKIVRIYFTPSDGKIWAATYVPPTPYVTLNATQDVLQGHTITLEASSGNFTATPTYAYSVSTDDGVNYTPITGFTGTSATFVAGTSGTTYIFKVEATYNSENAQATTTSHVVVCTVAGGISDSEEASPLWGTRWNTLDTNNDMEYHAGEGKFEFIRDTIYLDPANLEYKVALNHAWGIAYPEDNKSMNITKSGYYNIKITLKWEDKSVEGSATFLYPKIELMGSFLNNWEDKDEMTPAPNGLYGSKTYHLMAGAYEFNVKKNNNATNQGNTNSIDRLNDSGLSFMTNDANCRLIADMEGDYTFSFTYNNFTMAVEFPENQYTAYHSSTNSANFKTVCLPYSASLSNAKVYKILSNDGSIISLEQVESLVKGYAYIYKPIDKETDVIATFTGNVTNTVIEDNGLFGNIDMNDVLLLANDENYDYYILSNNEFHHLEGSATSTVAQFKGYIRVAKSPNPAPTIRIMETESTTTDIQSVEAGDKAAKFFNNGQLFILRDGIVYDAMGKMVH